MRARLSKLEKSKIFYVLGMVTAAFLAVIFLCLPAVRNIKVHNREIGELRGVVGQLLEMDKNPSLFTGKKEQLINDLNVICQLVPNSPQIPRVIEKITEPIKELGISLISITPRETTAGYAGGGTETYGSIPEGETAGEFMETDETDVYYETPIEICVRASYKQFGEFLDQLRHMPRLLIVDGFEVESDSKISPQLDIKLVILVFHYGKE